MRIVALSDTHGYHRNLNIPDGDLLIYAGDFSMRAKMQHVTEFADWVNSLPHKHKVVIPGNHDCYCEDDFPYSREIFGYTTLLHHEECTVMGKRIFGSPYSSCIFVPSIWSFDYPPLGPRAHALWESIPDGIDILVTHGPPKGILDRVDSVHPGEDPNVGDAILREQVERVFPRVHIFGHIHEGYGSAVMDADDPWSTRFYNVCVCNVKYQPINPVTVIDLDD